MKIKAVNVDNVGTDDLKITPVVFKKPDASTDDNDNSNQNDDNQNDDVNQNDDNQNDYNSQNDDNQNNDNQNNDNQNNDNSQNDDVVTKVTDEMWGSYLKEKYGVDSFDGLKQKITEENKPDVSQDRLPTEVDSFLEWRKENSGGTMSEYITVTKDWSNVSDDEVINTYMKLKKPHLSPQELDFEINRMFSVDEELDSDSDVMAKQIAKKDFLEGAKQHFKKASENFKPSRLDDIEIPTEYKDAFSKYNEMVSSSEEANTNSVKQRDLFKTQTDKYFSEEFKGFEFKVGENESKVYMPSELDKLKESNLDLTNMLGKYVNQDGSIKDTAAYHRAISIASDPDGFAKFFFEQGKSEGVEDITNAAKNRITAPRTTLTPEQTTSKVRKVDIGGSNYQFKLRKQ